jgi:hypothetical protein
LATPFFEEGPRGRRSHSSEIRNPQARRKVTRRFAAKAPR